MIGELEVQSPTIVLLTAIQLPDRPILPSIRWTPELFRREWNSRVVTLAI